MQWLSHCCRGTGTTDDLAGFCPVSTLRYCRQAQETDNNDDGWQWLKGRLGWPTSLSFLGVCASVFVCVCVCVRVRVRF